MDTLVSMGGAMPMGPLGGRRRGDEQNWTKCSVFRDTHRMKTQLTKRLASPLIQDAMARLCRGDISAEMAASELGLSRSRVYILRTEYLLHCGLGNPPKSWTPGVSGGDHAPEWPEQIALEIRRFIDAGYSYAFAASELERLHAFHVDRSQLRRWAISRGLVAPPRKARPPAHMRRWQRQRVGELWQLDATPDYWFGRGAGSYPLLDMLDDCSRVQVGCRIYRNETLYAYIHFLREALMANGLPLQIYVDRAAVFRGMDDRSVTGLHLRLKFYGISFVFANSPESKGKVERLHKVWQERLPVYFKLNHLDETSDLEAIDSHVTTLVSHRNHAEIHREIGCTPSAAMAKAIVEGRSALRPFPNSIWWEYVWSIWRKVTVGPQGIVSFEDQRFPTQEKPGERGILCEHMDGSFSVIRNLPAENTFPQVLFTNRPKLTPQG